MFRTVEAKVNNGVTQKIDIIPFSLNPVSLLLHPHAIFSYI